MADDLDPNKKRIVNCVCMLGSNKDGERRNAFTALLRTMQSEGLNWSDIGNAIERGFKHDDSKFTEAELQEFGRAMREAGVEAGIKIGLARQASAGNGNGNGNGHLMLPPPLEMADFCAARRRQLKNDAERTFVDEMVHATRNQMFTRYRLKPGQVGYLASLYIKHGGKY